MLVHNVSILSEKNINEGNAPLLNCLKRPVSAVYLDVRFPNLGILYKSTANHIKKPPQIFSTSYIHL